jgi:hypothetical protein
MFDADNEMVLNLNSTFNRQSLALMLGPDVSSSMGIKDMKNEVGSDEMETDEVRLDWSTLEQMENGRRWSENYCLDTLDKKKNFNQQRRRGICTQ